MASTKTPRRKVQECLLKLAGKRSAGDIDLAQISASSKVSIEEITSLYGSIEDIFWDILSELDSHALMVGEFSDDDTVHDKIFDLLMRRFESLEEHKKALRHLSEGIDNKAYKSLFVNSAIVRSMGWILEAAGVSASGLDGEARKRALAWVYGLTFETFLLEDDAGLPKTMMVLDRSLTRASVWQSRINDAGNLAKGAVTVLASLIENLNKSRHKPGHENESKSSGSTEQNDNHL